MGFISSACDQDFKSTTKISSRNLLWLMILFLRYCEKKLEQNLDSMFFNRRDKIHIKNISPETFPFTCKLPPFLKQLRKNFTLYHNVSKSSNFEHTRLYVKKTACSLIANIFIWKYEKLLVCTASGVVFWLLLDIY